MPTDSRVIVLRMNHKQSSREMLVEMQLAVKTDLRPGNNLFGPALRHPTPAVALVPSLVGKFFWPTRLLLNKFPTSAPHT